jgi:hypothetical protein
MLTTSIGINQAGFSSAARSVMPCPGWKISVNNRLKLKRWALGEMGMLVSVIFSLFEQLEEF